MVWGLKTWASAAQVSVRRWRLQSSLPHHPRCCSTTLDDPPILEIKTRVLFRVQNRAETRSRNKLPTTTMQKLLQNIQKWRKKFQHKIQYEKFQAKEEEQWIDENMANERLERYIVQIFHLRSTGIPANPDRLVALMDDGSFVPLNVCQQ